MMTSAAIDHPLTSLTFAFKQSFDAFLLGLSSVSPPVNLSPQDCDILSVRRLLSDR